MCEAIASNDGDRGIQVFGRCVSQCEFRPTFHCSHCCQMCETSGGAEHDKRCDGKPWRGAFLGAHAFSVCFPSNSTIGRGCGLDLCALSAEAEKEGESQVKMAASIFREHGFVVLKKALAPSAVDDVLDACRSIQKEVALHDTWGLGNRDPGRYSFNSCVRSGNCMHVPAFVEHLVDNAFVLDVLDEIYGGVCGGGRESVNSGTQPFSISRVSGDFCCGWVEDFQALHSDMGDACPLRDPPPPIEGPDGSLVFGWFGPLACNEAMPIHDRSYPPAISVNFSVQPLTRWNGPTRIVSWQEMAAFADENNVEPPDLARELRDRAGWLSSRIFPLEAGDALIRDVRVWHGGCPNLSGEARYLPSLEVASPEYHAWLNDMMQRQDRVRGLGMREMRSLPLMLFDQISDSRARERCRDLVNSDPAAEVNQRVGHFDWLGRRLVRPRWAKPFPAAELGSMEVELAGLLAVLETLTGKQGLLAIRNSDEHGSGVCKLKLRLEALQEGRLRPSWLFAGSLEAEKRCAAAAGELQHVLSTTDVPSLEGVTLAACSLRSELEALVAASSSISMSSDIADAEAKRRRLV